MKRLSPTFRFPTTAFQMTGDPSATGAATGAAGGAAMGTSVMPGWGTAVGAVAGGLLGAFGGGGGSSSSQGMTLPPELEYQYLQDFSAQRDQLHQLYQQSAQLAQTYQDRFSILSDTLSGSLPSKDSLSALTNNTLSLINVSGQSAHDLAANGFLSSQDLADLNSLISLESADFKDPVFDKSRADEKWRLVQQLRKGGASDQQMQQAIARFDMDTTLGSFQASQQLKQSQSALISNRIGLSASLRQQNYGQVQGAIGNGMGAIGQFGAIAGQIGQLGQAGYQIGSTGIQQQQQIQQGMNQNYTTAGGFKFSNTAKKLVNAGRVEGIGALPIYAGRPAGGNGTTLAGLSDKDVRMASLYGGHGATREEADAELKRRATYNWK